MGRDTMPFFVVSSGRSGTQSFEKLFGSLPEVEMHHEYLCTHIQPVAAKYSMGLINKDEVLLAINSLHKAAVANSIKPLWGDSSNKLSWIIPELSEQFPKARFIYLVRDGRKVAASFFHKLADEIYDDRSVELMSRYLSAPDSVVPPPPEKRYWWKIPRAGEPFSDLFASFTRFQRIVYHWVEVNRVIMRDLALLDPSSYIAVRLEDLVSDPAPLRSIMEFLGLPYRDELFEILKRPHNVTRPVNYMLTEEEREAFFEIAAPMMERLGYMERAEYALKY